MAQYKHRGYSISISIKRFDDKVRVETEIFSPPEVDDRDRDRSLAGDTSESVSVARPRGHPERGIRVGKAHGRRAHC